MNSLVRRLAARRTDRHATNASARLGGTTPTPVDGTPWFTGTDRYVVGFDLPDDDLRVMLTYTPLPWFTPKLNLFHVIGVIVNDTSDPDDPTTFSTVEAVAPKHDPYSIDRAATRMATATP